MTDSVENDESPGTTMKRGGEDDVEEDHGDSSLLRDVVAAATRRDDDNTSSSSSRGRGDITEVEGVDASCNNAKAAAETSSPSGSEDGSGLRSMDVSRSERTFGDSPEEQQPKAPAFHWEVSEGEQNTEIFIH